MVRILQRGAEAIIYLENDRIKKERIKKAYRIEKLDLALRKSRTKREAKILEKLGGVIKVPRVLKKEDFIIWMEYVNGVKLADSLEKLDYKSICQKIGKSIARMHNAGIIHGDLTTSNMILKDREVYFIDFGLGFFSRKIEDMAVDLHLLRQALDAKHYTIAEECFRVILDSYNLDQREKVLERLKKVESRGRYKVKRS